MTHNFHIPVLGLAFSIDTPVKVAPFGISSVLSIVDDELIERMRKYYCAQFGQEYVAINSEMKDSRANRITAYLNLLHHQVKEKIDIIKAQSFELGNDIWKYFNMLPSSSEAFQMFQNYIKTDVPEEKTEMEEVLRQYVQAGSIDVNIMAKVDKTNFDKNGAQLEAMYSDASAALRGYATSDLESSIVISAGMNPKLFSYMASFDDFFPDEQDIIRKKVILKVSDYRSALIQAKFLAKKGLWVSEFRIESGLNCGGHAFATEGYLTGPILQEFKDNRSQLNHELYGLYSQSLLQLGKHVPQNMNFKITVQGGIGTGEEHLFLMDFYDVNGTGWGSAFLLVPEATTVDEDTLNALAEADTDDYYLSDASPLGVPFNNFRKSTAEKNRLERIEKGRAGAACTKKYLISNKEFSNDFVCTASRVYQHHKIKELENKHLDAATFEQEFSKIVAKTCLCEGLASAAYLKYGIQKPKENTAVAICPGPNLAYFNRTYTLQEMVNHIYGKTNVLENVERPHIFINELNIYLAYFKKLMTNPATTEKQLVNFHQQLLNGITYYTQISHDIFKDPAKETEFLVTLSAVKQELERLMTPAH